MSALAGLCSSTATALSGNSEDDRVKIMSSRLAAKIKDAWTADQKADRGG